MKFYLRLYFIFISTSIIDFFFVCVFVFYSLFMYTFPLFICSFIYFYIGYELNLPTSLLHLYFRIDNWLYFLVYSCFIHRSYTRHCIFYLLYFTLFFHRLRFIHCSFRRHIHYFFIHIYLFVLDLLIRFLLLIPSWSVWCLISFLKLLVSMCWLLYLIYSSHFKLIEVFGTPIYPVLFMIDLNGLTIFP